MSVKERERVLDVTIVAEHFIETLDRWGAKPEDVVWAIHKGAGNGRTHDKRSKRLMGACQYGGSRLVPYDGVWTYRGNEAVLMSLNVVESVMRRRITDE